MNRWFRIYDEALDDPKVQALVAEDFRGWFNLLCLANRNGGRLPSIEAIAFALRLTNIDAGSLVDRLRIATLIDVVKGGPNGSAIAPHAWDKRQYKSDGSTERVKRYRKRFKTVSETADETPPEAEAEKKKKEEEAKPELNTPRATPSAAMPDDLRQVMQAASMTSPPSDAALLREWRSAGISLDDTILPNVRRLAEREIERGKSVSKLKYFDQAIREEHAADRRKIEHYREVAADYAERPAA